MSFEVVEQQELWIAGVATRTKNADEMTPERSRLARLWQRAAPGGAMMAVLTDYESDREGEYTQVVGRAIADPRQLADTQVAVRIPAGTYARLMTQGEPPESIIAGWREVWSAEQSGGLRRAYGTDFESWPESAAPEIYISIQA